MRHAPARRDARGILVLSLMALFTLAAVLPILAPRVAAQPSLTVSKVAVTPVVDPGGQVRYTVTVANTGGATATKAWVNDTLPPIVTFDRITAAGAGISCAPGTDDCVITDLGPGKSKSYTIRGIVSSSAAPGTTFTNWVFLNYTDAAGTVYPQMWDQATASVRAPSDLRLDKSADATVALPNSLVTFTIRYDNTATSDLPTVWINDTLPGELQHVSSQPPGAVSGQDVRWIFAPLAPGADAITLVARVLPTVPDGTPVQNDVTADFLDPSGMPAPTVTAATSLVVQASLPDFATFTKVASRENVEPGGRVDYTLWFNNTGSEAAMTVTIRDTIPAGTLLVNPSAPPTVSGRTHVWTRGNVTGSNAITYTLVFTDVSAGDTLINAATLNATSATGLPLAGSPVRATFVRVSGGEAGGIPPLMLVLGGLAVALSVLGFLLYRTVRGERSVIEEVFLMHRNGVLLYHLGRSLKGSEDKDKDILAGMLTIVQDFVRDGFRYGERRDLQRLEFGEYRIVIERGQNVFLAVVLSGEDPKDLNERVQKTIREIEEKYGEHLSTFDGNLEPILGARESVKRMFRR